MKFFVTPCAAILVILAVSGCTSQFKDITVATESNPRVDIAGYETYAWAGAAAIISDPDREWTPPDLDIGAEIQFLIDRELRKRGMTQVADDPDALVVYGVGVDMKFIESRVGEDDVEQFDEVPLGGILVLLTDPRTQQVMWIGAAESELSGNPDRDRARKRLDYAITTMFKQFSR